MFQPQPAATQRRHRRLPSGTVVSYAEVKSYLSKREIPQLFESLMAGLMYHRPENHIGYLQTCLDEVKSNSETKVHWSTFVNKKRKSKEILPPLTPKKQDSFSSSWSDNSRQSTPLPPISARTRTRTSPDQQDLRNTYILYHNPPPILAKPKVPVVSVLGGLGARIDELCEKVVGRLRGVVHISTCSMLKTRMTIEGFYRVTSVPACAVVDSVLQAMSMVQSANALLVAGFPRNRGDIEEYRSRRVRMDGVVLVDFEEEALRQFLNKEVSSGALRVSDIESELERYKQDIISVAEYYDEKELLTVVMGDQDTDEMIEDMVIAVDKIIETRKDFSDEDSLLESKGHDCNSETPYKALVPSPTGERPSTVEIRDATEEDIKSIEAESRNSAEIEEQDENISPKSSTDENKASTKEEIVITENGSLDQKASMPTSQHSVSDTKQEDQASQSDVVNEYSEKSPRSEKESGEEFTVLANASDHALSQENEEYITTEAENKQQDIPILFAFENIKTDYDVLKDLVVNEMEMCYINFHELIRNDDEDKGQLGTDESLNLLQRVLKQDSVSYSSGFFISDFPFDLLKESKFEKILSLGEVSFVCKVKEKSFETEIDEEKEQEEALFESPMSKQVRIIFVTESNIVNELKSSLQEIVSYKEPRMENSIQKSSGAENNKEIGQDLGELSEGIDKEEKVEIENKDDSAEKIDKNADDEKSGNLEDVETSQNGNEENPKSGEIIGAVEGAEEENPESISEDKTSRDDHEDSTCQDVDDLITDDTLNERTKPRDSLQTEENKDASLKENVTEDSLSQISEEGTPPVDVRREKAVLARQPNLDLETTSASEGSTQRIRDEKAAHEKPEATEINSIAVGSQEEGTDGEVCEGLVENSTAQVASTESQEDGKDSGSENEASQDLTSVEENKDAKQSETECVQHMQDNDEEEEKADQNERKGTSNEQTETDNIENGRKSQENSEIENQIQTDETKSNQINESDNSASASKETKQEEEEDFGSEAKNERAQNDEDVEESEAKISDSPDSEIKENDNLVSESKEKDNPVSETKEDDSQVSETKEDESPVSEAKEDDNPVSETKEDNCQVSETKEDDSQVSETKEDDSQVSETKEDEIPVSEIKEDGSPVSETKKDDSSFSETKEDDNSVSEIKEDDNPVSETREDDNSVSDTKEDDSLVSETKEDGNPVSEIKEDGSQVSDTKEDENRDSATTNDENPMESNNVMNNEQDTSQNDENEKHQDVSKEIDEGFENKNASTDKADNAENKENSEKSIEINNNEDENRNSQDESSATDIENVENNKSEVENSTRQGSAADIIEEATSNDITADKTDNEEITDKINNGDTENKIGNGDSSDKMVCDEFRETTDNEEILDKTNKEEFVHKTDNGGPADQTNNGETDDQIDNDDLADKTDNAESVGKAENEESTCSSNKISVHDKENSGTVILKSMDNDSDSNDENGDKSITIETKAEVHAPDSISPPLLQATEKKSENTSSTFDSAEVENDEDQKDNDNEDSNFLKNELTFGNTDESQLTTDINVQNERFSGKIQERNGSGILDESRHEDHTESEQQERSSSSSRGEL